MLSNVSILEVTISFKFTDFPIIEQPNVVMGYLPLSSKTVLSSSRKKHTHIILGAGLAQAV
jgi:hypothetical protein